MSESGPSKNRYGRSHWPCFSVVHQTATGRDGDVSLASPALNGLRTAKLWTPIFISALTFVLGAEVHVHQDH
jgi:hypothetical protein